MMEKTERPQPFELKVNVRTLPNKGQLVRHTATEEERSEIAVSLGLIGVSVFEGDCHLTPWKRDGVKLSGTVKADIVQPCAVTLEPLDIQLVEPFELVFVPEGSKLARPPVDEDGEIVFDPEGDDLPDTFVGDAIDVASVWMEFMALGIDPFARKPGAELPVPDGANGSETGAASPFAVLSQLKKQ